LMARSMQARLMPPHARESTAVRGRFGLPGSLGRRAASHSVTRHGSTPPSREVSYCARKFAHSGAAPIDPLCRKSSGPVSSTGQSQGLESILQRLCGIPFLTWKPRNRSSYERNQTNNTSANTDRLINLSVIESIT